MDKIEEALSLLRAERDRIDAAIAALTRGTSTLPAKAAKKTSAKKAVKKRTGGMSEEGRKRIAEAQRKRWAAAKKATK